MSDDERSSLDKLPRVLVFDGDAESYLDADEAYQRWARRHYKGGLDKCGSPPRPRRTGAAGRSAALAARERGPSAVDAGVASTRAARSNRLVRGLLLLQK